MKRAVSIMAAAAGIWLSFGSAAHAASITSGTLGNGRGCTDSACFNVTLRVASPAPAVTGDLGFDAGTLQLEFDLTLASAFFNPVAALGGNDNGVTSLEFQSVRYQGTGNLLFLSSTNTWMITGGSVQIDGTAAPSGAGSPTTIDVTTSISGSCSQGGGNTTCGIIASPGSFGVSVNGATRYFSNTLNVTAPVSATPEPVGASLLGLALGGLALLRSRHS